MIRRIVAFALLGLTAVRAWSPYPALYSYGFVQPLAPLINVEFTANIMQHKYNVNVSNIVAGQIYHSLAHSKVRVDYAYDGSVGSSLFDFSNVSAAGLVSNAILSYQGSVTTAQCDAYYASPAFPLFTPDILQSTGAVYAGYADDQMYGELSAWELLYGGTLPVTVYLDASDTFVRYDFAVPGNSRTFTTTRYFNIHPTNLSAATFDSICH